MSTKHSRYTRESIAQKGDEIYERAIRPKVEDGNFGKVVAIDIETESFEMGENAIQASDMLLTYLPDAEIWFVRVGHRALHRIGAQAPSRPR